MPGFRMPQQMLIAMVFAVTIGTVGVVSAQPGQAPGSGTGQSTSQPGAAAGPSTSGTATDPASAGEQPGLDPDRRVCRSQETLGSRLRKRTVCRTAAEWDQLDRQSRQDGKDMTDRNNINYTDPKMGGG